MSSGFHGLPTRSISSAHIRLEFLAEAGPRVVRLFVNGSDENLLAELPDVKWATPYGDYRIYGGHRLWHAPEGMPRSYIPDNEGLIVEDITDGVRLSHPAEIATGIRKRIEIHLHVDRPAVTLRHQLVNEGKSPIECAPWAITQLQLGGVAIMPQPAGALDADGLLPNRHLALWPYARWRDDRLHLDDDLILVQGRAQLPPLKIGCFDHHGWIAYLREGVLFVKRFRPRAGEPHPDFNCNVEVYCDDRVVELETLAPLRRLEPGQSATHVETWEARVGIDAPPTPDGARAAMSILEREDL